MKKRMLLAAVGDYRGLAPELKAPVQELDRWQRLLMAPPYELVPIRPALKDATATKRNILDGLEELLADAGEGDQLVFVFLGHGSNLPVRGAGGSSTREQVILAYPDRDLKSAIIRYSDVRAIIEEHTPHAQADIACVIESCYAEGVIRDKNVTSLFVPLDDTAPVRDRERLAVASSGRVPKTLAFTDLATTGQAMPASRVFAARRTLRAEIPAAVGGAIVVLAASRKDEAAYQVRESEDVYRLLFSQRALARMGQTHESFDDIVANITPLRNGFPQHAEVHGDPLRTAENFPGQHPSPVHDGFLPPSAPIVPESSSIYMRVLGLGCFIEPRPDSPFLNRIVFPYDTVGVDDEHHFSFVEISQEDIHTAPGSITGTLEPETYYRGGVLYNRWTLSNHRVWLYNGDESQGFTRSQLFQTHVPYMPAVCPELTSPRDACYDAYPDPQWFTGFIDIAGGSADIGQLEQETTYFTRQYGDTPTNWSGRTPRSVRLEMHFTGPHAILFIADIDGGQTAQIFLKPGANILTGNAREQDITGGGLNDTHREHFLIFYSLTDPVPANPGLPAIQAAPINACSVVRFP